MGNTETGLRTLLFIICCLAAPPAAAETDIELAKQHYDLGEKLYKRSDFKAAIVQFEKSYAHSKKPALLFNIAHCHESMGHFEQAIEFYRRFLENKPDNAAIVRSRIKNLERMKADRDKPSPAPVAPPPSPARSFWIPGWVLVGTGAALAITGAGLGAASAAKADELEEASRMGAPQSYSEYEDLEGQGKALELGMIVTLAVGGAALATGAVLLILDLTGGESPEQAWIMPGITAGGAALSAGVRF